MRRMASVALAATLLVSGVRSAGAATALLVPQGTAFATLEHSCGGIQEQAFATGFDDATGFPTGAVYVQTRCGGSGRAGGYHVTTYSAWLGVTWDLTGAVVSSAMLAAEPPGLDPAFAAFDGAGNEVYDTLNVVNGASCSVGNTTYCTYRAWLALAPGFVPRPRVASVSGTTGPATGGTSVTIAGTGFTGATAVDFGAAAAAFTVNGDTSISAVSPAGTPGPVDVTVTTPGGTSAPTASDVFTFVGAPIVSALDPASGSVHGGTTVTITGAGLSDASAVAFGETPAEFTVIDDQTIVATAPAAETPDAVQVTVITLGGTSATTVASRFAYMPPVCGDGIVDPGEDCDDGAAGRPGDCCTASCTFQAPGVACGDDGDLCTADACDGDGGCMHQLAPDAACAGPGAPKGATLVLRTSATGRTQAAFAWSGSPVTLADYGDPAAGDRIALCVYDALGPGTYALALRASPDGSPDGAWATSATGWTYKSPSGAPDGITGVRLRAGARPIVQVKAKGNPAFTLPLQHDPAVVAQVKTSLGTCWSAVFSTPTVDTAAAFKAKSD